MKTHLLAILILVCSVQLVFPQEDDGVVAFDLPIRNSLTFNRYAINPTFSFVRQQNKFVSFSNKREWIQFENAPETFLGSYSGRFAENIGAGIAVFQQNYGVLTTFGGLINLAYNVRLNRDKNLTFGLNVGAYKSGINTSNVITNFDDPSLQNIPSNFLLTVNPGINYGTEFLDFGLSVNNLVLYNFESSLIVEDNPKQGLQLHAMHTGYFKSRGFFKDTRFTAMLRSEFRTEETIISGIAMLNVPKGLWLQVGYNNVFGVSGGLGLNITKEIALEYNIEKAIGELVEFGTSHEISLAYRFITKKDYKYNGDVDVSGLFTKKRNAVAELSAEELEGIRARAAQRKEQRKLDLEAKKIAKKETQEKAKVASETKARLLAEEKVKKEAEAVAKIEADKLAKERASARKLLLEAESAKLLADKKAQDEADAQAKLLAEQKAKETADAQAKLLAEQKAKEVADAQAKLLDEQKAKEDVVANPEDALGKTMKEVATRADEAEVKQNELLQKFDAIVEIKNKDLKDLKEENDLSDKGITVAPRPFKSITAENNALNAIKENLNTIIESRNTEIEKLKTLYEERIKNTELDEVNLFYKGKIKRLSEEQLKAVETQTQLDARLETIRIATEYEKRRRIKRAAFDNEDDRYARDRAMLQNIKNTTVLNDKPYKSEDFDFGEEQSNNIQLLKNIQNVDEGYYLVIAVHNNIERRNDFITKVVASGRTNVDFFYDVNTSKYYIYYDKFDDLSQANEVMKTKENRPYNIKMSLVKIEN